MLLKISFKLHLFITLYIHSLKKFCLNYILYLFKFSDALRGTQTEDQCMQDFLRLYQTNQQLNSLFTSGISYEEFKHGFHIAAYDLTTSMDGGTEAFTSPAIRVGKTLFFS